MNFDTTRNEMLLIAKIAERAHSMAKSLGSHITKGEIAMDITATHANGNSLDLSALLKADDFNFSHDVFGIYKHLDRQTGKLGDCFSPRYSQRQKVA